MVAGFSMGGIALASVFKNNTNRDYGLRYFWVVPHLLDEATSESFL